MSATGLRRREPGMARNSSQGTEYTVSAIAIAPLRRRTLKLSRRGRLERLHAARRRHGGPGRLQRMVRRPLLLLVLLGGGNTLLNALIKCKRILNVVTCPSGTTAALEDQRPIPEDLTKQALGHDQGFDLGERHI